MSSEPTGERAGVRVSRVRYTHASAQEQQTGLMGFIGCDVNDTLRLDGLALRRLTRGGYGISYPVRKKREQREHHVVRPVDERAERDVARQILDVLQSKVILR